MTALLAQKIVLPWGDNSQAITGLTLPFQSLGDIMSRVMPYVFAAAGIGLLLMLIRSGFSFLTSAGDTKKLEQARQRLTYALVGFIVIFVAYWIVQIFGIIFGVKEINT
ncbi:hypothetical protein HY031_02890, partial [Candidatus Gottesmanbacteria bacterium]|nr:hypothetical protein [Candidatus Gottesmanbacteria bacterium]